MTLMSIPIFIGGIGGPELMIVLFLAILLFGANKLPKLARASGEAMGEFQKGREKLEREIDDATATVADSSSATDRHATDAAPETSATDAEIDSAKLDAVETEADA